MPVNLYYTQKVRGFQQTSVKYSTKSVEIRLKRTKHQCPHCGSTAVTVEPIRIRRIRGEPLGSCRKVVLEFTIHRLYCRSCHHRETEHIPFLSHPKARLTKALERTILELRSHMSIQALANYYDLRWHAIKELEKKQLKRNIPAFKLPILKQLALMKSTSVRVCKINNT